MKTDRGAAARFKVSAGGKIMRRKAFHSHLLEKKSSTRKRRLVKDTEVSKNDRRAVRRLLGI
jgi:large subunit ribosomal protein L35